MVCAVKTPVIMQMETTECAVASLCMVLAHHGKWVPLEQMRVECGVSRNGVSIKNLIRAAEQHGLAGKEAHYKFDDVKSARFPVIILWKRKRYVVLNGFERNKAIINDPEKGRIKVDINEFGKSFAGLVLEFEKAASFTAGGKPKSILAFAKKRLNGTLRPFFFLFATGMATTAIGLIYPSFSRIFMDNILTQNNPEWLYPFIFVLFALILARSCISIVSSLYIIRVRGRLEIEANTSFFWHVLQLPMEFFSQRLTGDILSRQNSNESIADTLMEKLAPIFLDCVFLVFYFLVMLNYSVLLTALGLSTQVINIFVARYISKKRMNINRAAYRDAGKLSSACSSAISMIETIKASGAENSFFERWAGYQASVESSVVRSARLEKLFFVLPDILVQLSSISVLVCGVFMIINGEFTVGMLLAFQILLSSIESPIKSLISMNRSIQEMRVDMERIDDIMAYEKDAVYNLDIISEDMDFNKLSGSLLMKDVTFGYCKLDEPLIRDFNLELKPGEKVALVGYSGCGKSTIARLISGLLTQWSGEILFDGKSRENIQREIFTSSVASVDQNFVLFEDTIASNVKMWDSSIEDFEMIIAARDAQLHPEIMLRNGGYNAPVLENGKNFSGGQRQRMEIARVLAQDPTLIILDEATSALDAKTEYALMNAIKDRGITCVIVAHRLSTIRDCNEIVVLDAGKVSERGTHDELLANNGLYAKLVAVE